MGKYAAYTTVQADRSRDEIERTLTRYGADQFTYGSKDDGAVIGLRLHSCHIRFLRPAAEQGQPGIHAHLPAGSDHRIRPGKHVTQNRSR